MPAPGQILLHRAGSVRFRQTRIASGPKMNIYIHMFAQINPTVLPALRIAATFFFIVNLLGGAYIFRNRHRFFDLDPNVGNDIPATRKLRVETVMIRGSRLREFANNSRVFKAIARQRPRSLSSFPFAGLVARRKRPSTLVRRRKLVLSQTRDRALPLGCDCKILRTRTGIPLASD